MVDKSRERINQDQSCTWKYTGSRGPAQQSDEVRQTRAGVVREVLKAVGR
jgi:hypothetical protein